MTVQVFMELLGYAATTLTTVSFVPQALQTIRTRNTEGISLGMYGMLVAGVALWVVHDPTPAGARPIQSSERSERH